MFIDGLISCILNISIFMGLGPICISRYVVSYVLILYLLLFALLNLLCRLFSV